MDLDYFLAHISYSDLLIINFNIFTAIEDLEIIT